jgi:hypothetical protein
MKYYFLGLATLVVVICGCVVDGGQVFPRRDQYHAPPPAMMSRPGPMVDGPGPAVMSMMAAQRTTPALVSRTTQVQIVDPPGMHIGWKIPTGYAENQLVSPGRYNFRQGATYRLKLTNIPNRDGVVLYPTLQVYPAHPTTDAYLSHNSVPLELTDEDLDQVESNNFVTKVIYLPDPRFQDLAVVGLAETLVSTRLEPGVDPVAEADRRGTIMLVLRMGNMDMEMPEGNGGNNANAMFPGGVIPMAYELIDGEQGHHVPPMPIGPAGSDMLHVPGPIIVGGSGYPGMPAPSPVAGMGNLPGWGQVSTGTPIGLQGPPHIPLGRQAGLMSHTMRNLSKYDVAPPTRHLLIDVQHQPGISLPPPVRHIQYTEKHPVHRPGEAAYPAWARP